MSDSRGSRSSVSFWFRRRSSRSSHASEACEDASGNDGNDQDEKDQEQVGAAATRLSEKKIRLEFSTYARVDVTRRGIRSKKRYTFEYWGHDYERRRTSSVHGAGLSDCWRHSFDLFKSGEKKDAIVLIKPAGIQALGRDYIGGGIWVPPCEMRFLDETYWSSSIDIAE
jgi:hypothetical protein